MHETPIIVTGSSGLIGAAVCRCLEERGYRTFGLDRPGVPHPPQVTEAIDCDVADPGSVREALTMVRRLGGQRVASVIHLAAYYDFSGEPSDLYDKVTVRGTHHLMRLLHEMGFVVEQFLFSSTMLVHEAGEPLDRITEDSPIEAKWDYPRSKIAAEDVILKERGSIPVVLMRMAGVYTDQCNSIPIAHQIQRICERDFTSRVFPGDTDAGQAFVHLDDLVEAIRLAVEHRAQLPPVFPVLIGEEEVLSYRELQHLLGEMIHGKAWHTLRIPKVVAKAGAYVQDALTDRDPFIKPWMIDLADDHYAIDPQRARTQLGWKPQRSLRETLPLMVRLLKSDPDRFYRINKLEPSPSVARERAGQTSK